MEIRIDGAGEAETPTPLAPLAANGHIYRYKVENTRADFKTGP